VSAPETATRHAGASEPAIRVAPPRLAITGPMLGRNIGYVTTQGEFLTDLFREAGYDVISTSVYPGRLRRLGDITRTLIQRLRSVDVLIVETYSGPSFVVEDITTRIGQRYGKPVIMHLHGGAMPAFAQRYPRWTARVLKRAAALVAPSPYLAREVAPFAGPVRVIPNILELADYTFRLRERVSPRLLWMRAFHPIYNPVMAVRVLARVRAALPGATLAIAGQSKGMTADVAAAAHALGVADAVELLGFLDEREKRAVAARSDIFINTTHVDNAPVGVMEMCAMGLPVVSTAVGGIPDLLTDGETGLLVGDDDDDAMTEAVLRLVREPVLTARLSRNGPALAARCAWSAVKPQWEALFADVLRGARSAR
jgi:glycosyltransferase involved in cell wall biosynthesis